jgi:hypothetical protein
VLPKVRSRAGTPTASDFSSADGSPLVQDNGTGEWYGYANGAVYPLGFLNVKSFGATGDGITNDAAAIQTALDTGRHLWFPRGTYLVSSPLVISESGQVLVGEGPDLAKIQCNSGNMFTIGGGAPVFRLCMRDLWLSAGASAGHVFNQVDGIAQSHFYNLRITQSNPAKSIWQANGELYLDMHWSHFDLTHVSTATVPGFNMVDSQGGINSNTWEKGRVTYSGEFFFHLENQADTTYQYDNTFRNINFEICTGGGIKALGNNNLVVESALLYDCAALSATTRDFIYVGDSTHASPLKSRNISLRNVNRRSSTLGGGLVDIKFESGGVDHAVIEGGDNATLTTFAVDVGSNILVTILNDRAWTITNKHASTVRLHSGSTGATSFLEIGGNQIVSERGAAVADATDAASAITQLNALLARCRAHGLIAP